MTLELVVGASDVTDTLVASCLDVSIDQNN